MERLSIGQLAKLANVNLETIRYYERRGMLPKPPRNKSGYRQYSHEDVKRTDFIKRSQALGFSLKEVAELLSLRVDPDSTCADMKKRVEEKIGDVENKIADLNRIHEALLRLSDRCKGKGPIGKCPVLEELYR
ncbi:MAG: MerR family transcriptional regulator [Desulfobacteraceae bacterium]|nr:MAG: MerR family transcriptional regulator [Desulfobacteraceae bacterium]